MALYSAKTATHSECCFYDPSLSATIAVQGEREQTLREALWRDEFILHYQPIVTVADAAVCGFEALLRWRSPTRGLIAPSEFIPLAEETGLIVTLGEWALRAACREAVSWPDDLRVAVNVSAVQFQQPGLEQAVLGALVKSGLAPHRLELEITESVLMRDSEAVIACLHRLKALGVRIALDDFGTGFSSLSYLRRFPFDKIKIDRSFIRDIADRDTASIVRAIVGIGSRRGAVITAEGVETQEQLELVRQEGCTEVQGFLYSRPMTASEALSFVLTHRSRHAA
jgi:EAL domain-containing protein (putative c-di-GMP-specific phosphodiesterase class I)